MQYVNKKVDQLVLMMKVVTFLFHLQLEILRKDESRDPQLKHFIYGFFCRLKTLLKDFFPTIGFARSSRKKVVLPTNFEIQIFLKFNKEIWYLVEVNLIVNMSTQA